MQLDTEEGETFVPPAGVVASPVNPSSNGGELPGNKENTSSRAGEEPDSLVET
jgi:sorting nexin-1/2